MKLYPMGIGNLFITNVIENMTYTGYSMNCFISKIGYKLLYTLQLVCCILLKIIAIFV